jgi:hypothetical protein
VLDRLELTPAVERIRRAKGAGGIWLRDLTGSRSKIRALPESIILGTKNRQKQHGPKNKHVFEAVKEVAVLNSPDVVCQAPKHFLGRPYADPFADKEAQVNGVDDRR